MANELRTEVEQVKQQEDVQRETRLIKKLLAELNAALNVFSSRKETRDSVGALISLTHILHLLIFIEEN